MFGIVYEYMDSDKGILFVSSMVLFWDDFEFVFCVLRIFNEVGVG